MKSNIVYTNDTLIVKLYGEMDKEGIDNFKKKLYKILLDYDIDNIILNISKITKFNNIMFEELVNDYYANFNGHLTIKEA